MHGEGRVTTAYATEKPIDHVALYASFLEHEDDTSGTVVLHHGRVKRPGKQVPEFSNVELRALVADVDEKLSNLGRLAQERFNLNQVLIVHRIGLLEAGDSVLMAIASGTTRDRCFEACRWIVDEIKKEEYIELIERL